MSGTRKVQPPRAPNSWILFRSDFVRSKPGSQSNLSKEASKVWREMSDEEKLIYEAKAVLASKAHRQQYPDYRFNPIKSTRSRRSLAPSSTVRPSQLHVRLSKLIHQLILMYGDSTLILLLQFVIPVFPITVVLTITIDATNTSNNSISARSCS